MSTENFEVTDPDYELVDRIFPVHPPKDERVAQLMTDFRGGFYDLALDVVRDLPRTPERTIALRKIHEASQSVITAIAVNQHLM